MVGKKVTIIIKLIKQDNVMKEWIAIFKTQIVHFGIPMLIGEWKTKNKA